MLYALDHQVASVNGGKRTQLLRDKGLTTSTWNAVVLSGNGSALIRQVSDFL